MFQNWNLPGSSFFGTWGFLVNLLKLLGTLLGTWRLAGRPERF